MTLLIDMISEEVYGSDLSLLMLVIMGVALLSLMYTAMRVR
jgi:hypothetical protein